MSFGNTKSPTLQEFTSDPKWRPKFQVERGKSGVILLTLEQEADICKRYPTTPVRQLIKEYGLSGTFFHKFAREYRLVKDMKVIRKKMAKYTVKLCEANGYYDSIRGIPPSPQCMEASRRKRAEGFHPLLQLKKTNPRKYKKSVERRTRMWMETRAADKRKRGYGLDPTTGFHIPTYKFTKKQITSRHEARKRGYLIGDMHEQYGERYTFYYTSTTKRGKRFEENCNKNGFTIKEKRNDNINNGASDTGRVSNSSNY